MYEKKYTVGAIPNVTISAKESRYIPNSLVAFSFLATRPSNMSAMSAIIRNSVQQDIYEIDSFSISKKKYAHIIAKPLSRLIYVKNNGR